MLDEIVGTELLSLFFASSARNWAKAVDLDPDVDSSSFALATTDGRGG